MADYVIKSWELEENPPEGGESVRISGRASGFLSWLLSILKISPTVAIAVCADKISFESGSLEGSTTVHTPLENVCSTVYGYKKPWKEALAIGVLVGLLTFFLLGIPGIIVGILYYFMKKSLIVGFTDLGGRAYEVSSQRSVIEGQNIDEHAAAKVCAVIQGLVDARRALA